MPRCSFGAGLLTPPPAPTAGLRDVLEACVFRQWSLVPSETFGHSLWLGQETGHHCISQSAAPVPPPPKKQAGEKPLTTAAQALTLKNKSKQDNERILSALGRAATDDAQVDYEATINRHMLRDIKSSNPIMINTVEEFDIDGLTGVGLFTF